MTRWTQRWFRALMAAVVLMASVATMAPATSPAGAQTPPPDDTPAAATLALTATGGTAAPGGQAVVAANLWNRGLDAAAAPVVVTLSGLPAGVTVSGVVSDKPDTTWDCSATADGTACTLTGSGGAGPVSLDGNDAVGARFTLALDPSVAFGSGLTLHLATTVGPTTTPTPDLSAGATDVTIAPLPAGQHAALSVSDDAADALVAGASARITTTITNLGPDAVGGPSGVVTVTGALPPGATAWSASGTDWSCPPSSGSPFCTWSGPVAAPAGAALPALVLDFKAPAAATTSATPLTWPRVVTAPTPTGSPSVLTEARTADILVKPSADVSLTANAAGSTAVEAPGSVTTALHVAGRGINDPALKLTVLGSLPTGFTYQGVTSADPWVCVPSAGLVRCDLTSSATTTASDLSLTYAVSTTAVAGPNPLAFTSTVTGESNTARADDNAAVSIEVSVAPPPAATLRVYGYPGGLATQVTDGTAFAAHATVSLPIGLDAQNTGSSPIPAGTDLRLTADLPSGTLTTRTTDLGSPAWSCSTATVGTVLRLTCGLRTAAAVAVGAALPRLKIVTTLPASIADGPVSIPVALTGSRTGLVPGSLDASTVVAATVVHDAKPFVALTVSGTVDVTPRRSGRAGLLRVTVANTGTLPLPAGQVDVTFPTGLRPATPLPATCSAGYLWEMKLVCTWTTAIAPGDTGAPLLIPVLAATTLTDPATLSLQAKVSSGPAGLTTNTMSVKSLAPLTAVATATPNPVTSIAPDDQAAAPTVVLDGSASSSADATMTWHQAPAAGEPLITFDGLAAGQDATGPTASFAAPVITTDTALHVVLTVTDGTTTATKALVISEKAAPSSTVGGPSGWAASTTAPLAGLARLSAAVGAVTEAFVHPLSPLGSWTWTRDPAVSVSDTGSTVPTRNSRARLLDNGDVSWSDPANPPSDLTFTHEWQVCTPEVSSGDPTPPTCTPISTDDVVLTTEQYGDLILHEVASGTSQSLPVTSSEDINLGPITVDYGDPQVMVNPSISGTASVGETLTADPGQWTIENTKTYQWFRCGDATEASCTAIDFATDSQYVVAGLDAGSSLAVEVVDHTLEGGYPPPVRSAHFGPIPGSPTCSRTCFSWTTGPTVNPNSSGVGYPVAGFAASVTDAGAYGWADPANPPTNVTVTNTWQVCERDPISDSGGCLSAPTDVGTGPTYTPLAAGPMLLLKTVVSGTYPVDGSTQTAEITIGLGPINVPDAPQNLTVPTIAGTPKEGVTLTADPGTWDYAIPTNPADPASAYAYDWQLCSSATDMGTCASTGHTGPTFVPDASDVTYPYSYVRVVVTAEGDGTSTTASSDVTGPVVPAVLPPSVTASTLLPGGCSFPHIMPCTSTSVPNSAALTIPGAGTGAGTLSYAWMQTGGAPATVGPLNTQDLQIQTPDSGVGTLTFTLTVTDALGYMSSAMASVDYGSQPVPAILCQAVNEVASGGVNGTYSLTLGSALKMSFTGATVSPGVCGAATTLHLTNVELVVDNWLHLTIAAVDIDKDGVTFTGGTLTAPGDSALSSSNFRVVGSMHVPFSLSASDFELQGAVVGDSLPFLHLPGSWQSAAELDFGSAGGVQTIGLHGLFFDTRNGPATPSATGLPTPAAGSKVVDVAGALSSDKTFSLTLSATGLITFGSSGIDFSGSVARTAPGGAVQVTAQGTLTAPVQLATGVTLAAASLGWDGSSFTGSGTVGLRINSSTLNITASFLFSDVENWSFSLTVGGNATWSLGQGVTITNPTVTGTISRSGLSTSMSIVLDVANIGLSHDASLNSLHLAVSATCTAGSPCLPAVQASGQLHATVNGSAFNLSVSGGVDLAAGTFDLTASVGNLVLFPGVSISSGTLAVHAGGSAPVSVAISAATTVLSTPVTVTVTFGPTGTFFDLVIGTFTPFSGAPTFTSTHVVYSTVATTVPEGGQTLDVPAQTVRLVAVTTPPAWFNNLLGLSSSTAVVNGNIDTTTGNFDLSISFSFPSKHLFSTGGVSLDLSQVSFGLNRAGNTVTTRLGANAKLVVPAFGGGAPTTLDVLLQAAYAPDTNTLSGSVTLQGDWQNAFGITGLTVSNFTVSLSLKSGALPSIGLAGGVVLPTNWATKIGITPGTKVTLVASLGSGTSCFGFQVGQAGGTSTVLDVANLGAVTARYASFYFAPSGCTVGPYTIQPGLSLVFDGALLGTPVSVNAAIQPEPFSVVADVTIGPITLKGFTLNGATMHVAITPVTQQVSLSASATILGATAAVSGSFSRGASGVAIDLSGNFTTPDLGGFQVNRLAATFHFDSSPPGTLSVSAVADLAILGVPESAAFSLTIVNGAVTEGTADVAVVIPIRTVTITANAHLHFVKGQFPDISLAGTATLDGRPLTSVSGHVTGGGVSITALLPAYGVFTQAPSLSGTIAWASKAGSTIQIVDHSGATVTAAPGDFRFDAHNVGLGVSGFSLSADVSIGNIGGTVWAEIHTSAAVALGSANANVALNGVLATNGDFDLSGTGAANLAGFQLASVVFALAHHGASVSFTGSSSLAVPNLATVAFTGSFSAGPSGVLYDLTGTGTINPFGYNLGSGSFHLYRRAGASGIQSGLDADARVGVSGVAGATGTLSIGSDGSMYLHAVGGMQGTLGSVLGSPSVDLTFYHGPQTSFVIYSFIPFRWGLATTTVTNLTFSAGVHDVMKVPGSFTVSGAVYGNGTFSLTAAAVAGPWGGHRDMGLCTARYGASGNFSVTISGSYSSPSINVTMDGSAYAHCGSLGISVGLRVQFNYTPPTSFSLKVQVHIHVSHIGSWDPTVYSA